MTPESPVWIAASGHLQPFVTDRFRAVRGTHCSPAEL